MRTNPKRPRQIQPGPLLTLALTGLLLAGIGTVAWAGGFNYVPTYTGGPNVCGQCHPDVFNDWLTHGHARKLAQGAMFGSDFNGKAGLTVDARSAGIPLPPHDADVYNWDNVFFVIGASKHWKTRFVGLDGYILTKNGKNQYNWETGEWVDYNKDVVEKPFDCGPCHTTGYRYPEEIPAAAKLDFDAHPGIIGDFAHANITCEECHGPGADHAAAPSEDNIVEDDSAAACGSCHTRGDDDTVALASGSFIRHHEQYPELLNGPHSSLDCVDCHDPHVGRAAGINVLEGNSEVCDTCHGEEVAEYAGSAMQLAGVKCQDCHMGKATRSARTNGPYEGDVWTHLFAIDSSADYDMFNRDGEGNAVSAKGALSLEYACFRCHADADKAAYAAIGDESEDYHMLGAK